MGTTFPRIDHPSLLHAAFTRLLSAAVRWWQWRCERWELLSMDERSLRDMGLTRTDARRIAGQPMWRR